MSENITHKIKDLISEHTQIAILITLFGVGIILVAVVGPFFEPGIIDITWGQVQGRLDPFEYWVYISGYLFIVTGIFMAGYFIAEYRFEKKYST
jgi:hypothetical protein